MLIQVSRPMNASINFFKGPYRIAGKVQGDSVAPPVSPEAVAAPFAFVAGQQLALEIKVSRADGRLSAKFRGTNVAGA